MPRTETFPILLSFQSSNMEILSDCCHYTEYCHYCRQRESVQIQVTEAVIEPQSSRQNNHTMNAFRFEDLHAGFCRFGLSLSRLSLPGHMDICYVTISVIQQLLFPLDCWVRGSTDWLFNYSEQTKVTLEDVITLMNVLSSLLLFPFIVITLVPVSCLHSHRKSHLGHYWRNCKYIMHKKKKMIKRDRGRHKEYNV